MSDDTPHPTALRALGDATRRSVLGDAHVNRSRQDPEALHAPFIDLVTDTAWGHVWGRGGIPNRERSMMTLAILAALGNWEEFELHLRATANTGASPEDVREVLMHVAAYAGIPRANTAVRIVREVLAEE